MDKSQKHRWALWTAIAVLPAVPFATYFCIDYCARHRVPATAGHLWLLGVLAYFITLAVSLRSTLIGWTIVGVVLESLLNPGIVGPGPVFWAGVAAGVIWDLCTPAKRRTSSNVANVSSLVANPDAKPDLG